jgi:hypothetical protein
MAHRFARRIGSILIGSQEFPILGLKFIYVDTNGWQVTATFHSDGNFCSVPIPDMFLNKGFESPLVMQRTE